MKNVDVLYEDEDCLVLNKPSGLATQGGAQVGASLDSLLRREWDPAPLLVHRLDKDTSGIILVAKTKAAAGRYAALIAGRSVRKYYLALCAGSPASVSGVVSQPLTIRGVSKESLTKYAVLKSSQDNSLLEIELGTGRMHQIRIHLARIGHPILGDDKYGDFALNRVWKKELGIRRLMLHAHRLVIPRAVGEPLDIIAEPPACFLPFLPAALSDLADA